MTKIQENTSGLKSDVRQYAENAANTKSVTIGAFSSNRLNISLSQSGGLVTIPNEGAADSQIILPVVGSSTKGFHVTLVCVEANTNKITIQQGATVDGTGTPAATKFLGILMDDAANALAGTSEATIVAGKFEKGDHIDLVCDGTNYIIKVNAQTAAAVTVA